MKINNDITVAYPCFIDNPDKSGYIMTYELNENHPQYEEIKALVEEGKIEIGITSKSGAFGANKLTSDFPTPSKPGIIMM